MRPGLRNENRALTLPLGAPTVAISSLNFAVKELVS